ncbi:MAG: alpha,alpha-trehalase TreF [Bacteroidota bacterium]
MKTFRLLLGFLLITSIACRQATPSGTEVLEDKSHLSPDKRFGELFRDVQMGGLFPDSKTFVDCTPKYATDELMSRYAKAKVKGDFDLKAFVEEHFELPRQYASGFKSDTKRTAAEHINALWPVLTRQPDAATNGSLLALPKSYIVPGGRFGEIYYWDSYFTILGLEAAGQWPMIENMCDNFTHLINNYGFIPNGNRTYFLGRSQPPFYSLIVKVLADGKSKDVYQKYLPGLKKEYNFWMDGLEQLTDNKTTHRRVVRMQNGAVLNRYWDDQPEPRPESYREDVELAESGDRPAEQLYRDIRAACESGWDFSSRWFRNGQYLSSIHTTEIIPVDLNALLYHLESVLADASAHTGDQASADIYREKAEKRKAALLQYCWEEATGFFVDYDFVKREPTGRHSLAGAYPLFFGLADNEQARKVAERIEADFLKPGGAVTTLSNTGEQWDAPNGWAPLQWICIKGLRNYEHQPLADTLKNRWVRLNEKVYANTGKMVEKYNVVDLSLEAGGGEYPVQDGFGWTNGILLRLLSENKTEDNVSK